MPRAGAAPGTGVGKDLVTVWPPPLTAPLVGVSCPPCEVAASPVTMATSAPADSAPATIFDRRAGDRPVSVIGITVGRFGLVVIVV